MTGTNNLIDKPTVLAVGLFVPGNGLTRVFESLFERLSYHFTIHWLGIGYKGEVQRQKNYTLHPCNVNGGDIYGAYEAAALAREVKAQSVLLLNDFYLLKNYRKVWLPLKQEGLRLLAYVPLDGEIVDISIIRDCLFLDEMVLYNEWALAEVRTAMEKFLTEQPLEKESLPRLSFRYHGVDTSVFYPSPGQDETIRLKQKLFKVADAEESIFILNANRYNERKDIERTVAAFAEALPGFQKPVYLCLHTPNLQPHLKERLCTLINDSGCGERILLNPLGEEYIADERLVNLYQACAIGVNTSFGEGWGLISFEHAACGAAQIVPGHTAPAEVWKDAAILIQKDKPVQLHTNPFRMYSVDKGRLAEELVKLVNNEQYLFHISGQCCQHAAGNLFNWDYIAAEWKELL